LLSVFTFLTVSYVVYACLLRGLYRMFLHVFYAVKNIDRPWPALTGPGRP
jgi:hypothetical protein